MLEAQKIRKGLALHWLKSFKINAPSEDIRMQPRKKRLNDYGNSLLNRLEPDEALYCKTRYSALYVVAMEVHHDPYC